MLLILKNVCVNPRIHIKNTMYIKKSDALPYMKNKRECEPIAPELV